MYLDSKPMKYTDLDNKAWELMKDKSLLLRNKIDPKKYFVYYKYYHYHAKYYELAKLQLRKDKINKIRDGLH